MAHLVVMVKTPIFATSPDNLRHRNFGQARLSQSGFTLIELLVVLAIAGLLLALAPVAYGKYRESAQYSSVLRTIASDIRQARQQALMKGVPVGFFVDLAERKYGISGLSSRDLPESIQVQVTVGREQLQEQRMATIVFLPEGGATGGSIDVLRPGGDGTRLRVDWLFGQITTEQLSP
jgi:general secretion pathway protein H